MMGIYHKMVFVFFHRIYPYLEYIARNMDKKQINKNDKFPYLAFYKKCIKIGCTENGNINITKTWIPNELRRFCGKIQNKIMRESAKT